MKTLRRLLSIGSCVLLISAAPLARAVNVAKYTFSGDSVASSDTDTNSTAGDLALGSGIAAFATPTTFFVNSPAMMLGSDHTPATEADAITGNDYFSFTVTPSAGGSLSYGVLTFNFAIQNNSNTIVENLSLRWSVDNFATNLGSSMATATAGTTVSAGGQFDLSASGAQSGPVEFRIYIYDDQNTQFSKVGIDTIQLDASFQAPPPRYRVIDLGTLGGNDSNAAAINKSGVIVGSSLTRGGDRHAFVIQKGVMRDLGVIAGDESQATSLNSAGQIVGASTYNRSAVRLHACLFSGGKRTDLGTLSGSADTSSRANAINDSNVIVGQAQTATGRHAVAFQNDAAVDLDPSGFDLSEAVAVNSAGTVVGFSLDGSGQGHAVIFSGGTTQDLGVLGPGSGEGAFCNAINDAGVIVGESQVDGTPLHAHAFVYDGTMMDLGTLDNDPDSNSTATGINSLGQIVGTSGVGAQTHAFLYTDGVMRDLQTLAAGATAGFTSLSPSAINDDGWIVGSGTTANGDNHAFLALPGAYEYSVMVATGDSPTAISNAAYSGFGLPAIDAAGDVAFRAKVRGMTSAAGINSTNNSGIWLYNGVSGTLIARAGDPMHVAPGMNSALFASFSEPVAAGNGVVAFLGKLKVGTGDATKANSVGVWRYQGGTLSAVVRNGDVLNTATVKALDEIVVDARGGLSFLATITDPTLFLKKTALALYGTTDSSVLNLVHGAVPPKLNAFKPLATVSGQTRTVDPTTGDIVDVRVPSGGVGLAVAVCDAATFAATQIVATGDSPAALAGNQVAGFGEPIINSVGNVAFTFTQTGSGITPKNNFGIMVSRNGGLDVLAVTGGFALDEAGQPSAAIYAKLGDPVLNKQNRIAFTGTLATGAGSITGKTNTGIWSDADGTLKLIAQEGDDAPGYGGGVFAKFDQIVLPDTGGVILLATLSGVPGSQNQGIWAVKSNGTVTNVVREGDSVIVAGGSKVVKKIGVFQVAPGVMAQGRSFDQATGKIAYLATFTDGSSAIVTAQP